MKSCTMAVSFLSFEGPLPLYHTLQGYKLQKYNVIAVGQLTQYQLNNNV